MTTPQLPERAAGRDQLAAIVATSPADAGAATDSFAVYSITIPQALTETAAASDVLAVTIQPAPPPTPALTAPPIASPAFIRSKMPRMYVQNLLTGQWYHRDVQGVTSPSITWSLNAPDTFTCTLAPPRQDMMDGSGNAVLLEWRDAVYLEEQDEIKFGGIVTSSQMTGPQWQITATGFIGYANGMFYEGPNINMTRVDALDAVRILWAYLQRQNGSNLSLDLGTQKAGFLIGAQFPPGTSMVLGAFGPFRRGTSTVWVTNAAALQQGNNIAINGDSYTVKTIYTNRAGAASGKLLLNRPLSTTYYGGMPVVQIQPIVPWTMYAYNNTDIGQDIDSIAKEAIFDYGERHTWVDVHNKLAVKHQMVFGVPRLGRRMVNLRFVEGENIIQAVTVTRDGSKYANDVIGLGAGSGSSQVHTQAANTNTGRLRRQYVYTDQTANTVPRIAARAHKVLTSMMNIDTVTQAVVINHPNAPWGSFGPGDDVLITLTAGWRNTSIWSRITQMTQDPQTDLITLTLARSDSYTYMPETGVAGTLLCLTQCWTRRSPPSASSSLRHLRASPCLSATSGRATTSRTPPSTAARSRSTTRTATRHWSSGSRATAATASTGSARSSRPPTCRTRRRCTPACPR